MSRETIKDITVDIKYKCPDGERGSLQGECKCVGYFIASLSNLYTPPGDPHYKECHHKGNIRNVITLKYGGQELKNTDGYELVKNKTITEICTYYSYKYDDGPHIIKKPLLLRIRNNGGTYWYGNLGNDNLTWKEIDHGEKTFYPDGIKNDDVLKKELDRLTCQLHKLHFVDIFNTDNHTPNYHCPVCKEYKVTVSSEAITDFSGYTKYKHEYEIKPDSVRYKDVVLKLKDEGDNDDSYGPIPLSEDIKNLSVYYWNMDLQRTKPLLMEAYTVVIFGNSLIPLGNDGNVSYNDNTKWSMMKSEDGDYLLELPQDKLKEKLQEQKCKLFNPVTIDVSQNEPKYTNEYCIKEGCTNDGCPRTIEVTNYNDPQYEDLRSCGYTAKKHTYRGNKPFTITSFINGSSEGNSSEKLTLWNVQEVVVFLPPCPKPDDKAAETPLILRISSGNGYAYRWSSNYCTKSGKFDLEEGKPESKVPRVVENLIKVSETAKQPGPELHPKEEGGELKQDLDEEEPEVVTSALVASGPGKLEDGVGEIPGTGPEDIQLPPSVEPVPTSGTPASDQGGARVDTVELLKEVGKDIGHVLGESVVAGLAGAVDVTALLAKELKEALWHIPAPVVAEAAGLVGKVLKIAAPPEPVTQSAPVPTSPGPIVGFRGTSLKSMGGSIPLPGQQGEYGPLLSLTTATLPVKGSGDPLSLPGAEGGSRDTIVPEVIGGYGLGPGPIGGSTPVTSLSISGVAGPPDSKPTSAFSPPSLEEFPALKQAKATEAQAAAMKVPDSTLGTPGPGSPQDFPGSPGGGGGQLPPATTTEALERKAPAPSLPADPAQAASQESDPPPDPESPQPLVGILTTGSALAGYAFSGTLAGAGATFFGGWKLYNRYKGDPWLCVIVSDIFIKQFKRDTWRKRLLYLFAKAKDPNWIVLFFVLRGSFQNAPSPLKISVMLQFTELKSAGYWLSSEYLTRIIMAITTVAGGQIFESYGYHTCFALTGCFYLASLAILLPCLIIFPDL
ncbi:hypothetical protein BEWA_039240 [Theileria equi strain WA]|uniref:Uncharacterized protein n=1 Tax=Theileria equi strain WA TaxID=1537102 RepID=L1LEW3_THEEQ|nr:hypothetical protein BEWA_039240 [Theileria equi strain WA]EKX73886.1 hypothetical protein BEWA_039240 [Theileria equi strain WA]|eukprot:XP_004833338.1 hypothetical protein BEWA_039240 [Theileria equi strain WA]